MQLIFRFLGQTPSLKEWVARAYSFSEEDRERSSDHRDHHRRVIGRESPGEPVADGLHRRAAQMVLAYEVFPSELLSGVLERSSVEIGDTVGACYHALPGIDLFFASRVMDRFDGPHNNLWRTGFTYRTLAGHPESGEETFAAEKNMSTGEVSVSLQAWSRPGIFLARVMSPLVRHWQLRASRAALDHLERTSNGR